jgi:hypothetical protein
MNVDATFPEGMKRIVEDAHLWDRLLQDSTNEMSFPTEAPAATHSPTEKPTQAEVTILPTTSPSTSEPTASPTSKPVTASNAPMPTQGPTVRPSFMPSTPPSANPTTPSSSRPSGECIGELDTFTTTIILDIDVSPTSITVEERIDLQNALMQAYQAASGCDTPGAFVEITDVRIVNNVTDAFGSPVDPIPWIFEINTVCKGCNSSLFADSSSDDETDGGEQLVCSCDLPTLSAYVLACNDILTETPLPNIRTINSIGSLDVTSGGGIPFTFVTSITLTGSCVPGMSCLGGEGDIRSLEGGVLLSYNRLNALSTVTCDPDGRVVQAVTFVSRSSSALRHRRAQETGETFSIIFELSTTCRAGNCNDQTVVFGDHAEPSTNGSRRNLLDISDVCPTSSSVEFRCPTSAEFLNELQDWIDRDGGFLSIDHVDTVAEGTPGSMVPSMIPSPSPTLPPAILSSTAPGGVALSPSAPPTLSLSPSVSPSFTFAPVFPTSGAPTTSPISPGIDGEWLRIMVLRATPADDGGRSNREFGASLSMSPDGSVLALGHTGSRAAGRFAGACRLYALDVNLNTSSIITDFLGVGDFERYGFPVTLSADMSTVMCGATPLGFSFRDGFVDVFQQDGSGSMWNPLGDRIQQMTEDGLDNYFQGEPLAMSSDATTVALGKENPSSAGSVQVYRLISDAWTPIGQIVVGVSRFGYIVALSGDGNTLLVVSRSLVQVFQYMPADDLWEQIGQSLEVGSSFVISTRAAISEDGQRIAVFGPVGFGGAVRGVFQYDAVNDRWDQVGDDIPIRSNIDDVILRGNGKILGTASPQTVFEEVSGEWLQLGDEIMGNHTDEGLNPGRFATQIGLSDDGHIAALTTSFSTVAGNVEIHRFIPAVSP